MRPSDPVPHGGALARACRLHGGRPEDWLDLSTGINPTPVALPHLPKAVWHRLPDEGLYIEARMAAARYYATGDGVLPLPVPGTQSVIQLLPQLLPPRRVAILGPTYGEYGAQFAARGWAVDEVRTLEAVGAAHQMAVVVNPNNPTGAVQDRAALLALADRMAARGGLLVVDEAFADMRPEASLSGEAESRDGLIVLRSFGKFFGLAGLRLGFAIARNDVLERLDRMLGPWAVSGPALAVAAEILADDELPSRLRRQIGARRDALHQVIDAAGLAIIGSADLFMLVETDRAAAIHDHLCRCHILVRSFDYAPRWLRFGLTAGAEEDQRLADALGEIEIRSRS